MITKEHIRTIVYNIIYNILDMLDPPVTTGLDFWSQLPLMDWICWIKWNHIYRYIKDYMLEKYTEHNLVLNKTNRNTAPKPTGKISTEQLYTIYCHSESTYSQL